MSAETVPMPSRVEAGGTGGAGVAELLVRAADGDASAWDCLVHRYSGLLWSVARAHRLPEAEAADVVQNTWVRLLDNVERIREPERLAGWLVTTARRESLRALRTAGRTWLTETLDDYDAPDAQAEPVESALLLAERDALLWDAFARLPPACQALLRLLVATPAPSYQDVAAALGRPVGSIGPTRGRCLQRLRTLLEAVEARGSDECHRTPTEERR